MGLQMFITFAPEVFRWVWCITGADDDVTRVVTEHDLKFRQDETDFFDRKICFPDRK